MTQCVKVWQTYGMAPVDLEQKIQGVLAMHPSNKVLSIQSLPFSRMDGFEYFLVVTFSNSKADVSDWGEHDD